MYIKIPLWIIIHILIFTHLISLMLF